MSSVTSLHGVLRAARRAAACGRARGRAAARILQAEDARADERRASEARALAAEARFRAALDASPDACMLLEAAYVDGGGVRDFVVTEVNAAARTLYRLPADATIGRALYDVFPTMRDGTLWAQFARVAETGAPYEGEYRTRDPRTTAEWLAVQVVALRGANGAIVGLAITARDITARKRADTERLLLHEVTTALGAAPDVAGALVTVLAAMCEATGMAYGEAWLPFDTAGAATRRARGSAAPAAYAPGTLVRGPSWHAPGDERLAAFAEASTAYTFAPGRGLPGRAATTGAALWLPDLDAPDVDYPRRALARVAGLRSGLAVPVTADGHVVAVLSFHARHAVAAGATELDLLRVVGAQLGAVLRRRQAEADLARERSFLEAVLDSLSEGIVVRSATSGQTRLNRAMREFHAAPVAANRPGEWSGGNGNLFRADGVTLMPFAELPVVRAFAERTNISGIELVVAPPGGPRRAIVTDARTVFGPDGEFLGVVCASRDMTAQKAAEQAMRESEARFRGVLENLRVFAVQLDAAGRVTFVNDALLAATGWTRDEVIGTDYHERFVADSAELRVQFARRIATADANPVPAHVENEIVTRDGARRLVAWDNVLLRDGQGRVAGVASVGRDVTEERHLAAERERLVTALADQAEQDDLTGLANRRGFRRMAAQERRSADRTGRVDAVCCVDLDRFKAINDTFGHAAGDGALRAVAGVIRDTIRCADFAARLGGDEFAIYAVGVAPQGGADVLAARLHAALAAHNADARAAGRPYEIAFSVGVTEVAPEDTLDSALARADATLYAAKPGRAVCT